MFDCLPQMEEAMEVLTTLIPQNVTEGQLVKVIKENSVRVRNIIPGVWNRRLNGYALVKYDSLEHVAAAFESTSGKEFTS